MEYINYNWNKEFQKKFFKRKKTEIKKNQNYFQESLLNLKRATFFLNKIREQKMPVSP